MLKPIPASVMVGGENAGEVRLCELRVRNSCQERIFRPKIDRTRNGNSVFLCVSVDLEATVYIHIQRYD